MTLSRRQFSRRCGSLGLASLLAPALSRAADRPLLPGGLASGDVDGEGAVIWSRSDRPSRLWVDVSADESFASHTRFRGGAALAGSDYNASVVLTGLEADRDWHYRVQFESLAEPGLFGESANGRFRTAPLDAGGAVRFCWSGDTVGQGYGIDTARGGMSSYRAMLMHEPQFLIHSGDQIYADVPVPETLNLDDGSVWRNLVTEGKSRPAESVQDFRDNYYYNYLDEHFSRFHREVPVYYQWDDHEVANNWYPGKQLGAPYRERSASLLAARSLRAMFDCNPLRHAPGDPERIYRKVSRGPLLDLFFIDLRSYRGANSLNRQPQAGPDTAFLGPTQLDWLKRALRESTATWKLICSDMPIALRVTDFGSDIAENWANGDGPPLGRELELAELLRFLLQEDIRNVHFLTADVHFCASYHYSPERARFRDFAPFWEFVSGPLHAGTFAPPALDDSFGPREEFCGVAADLAPNRPPSENLQFFGLVEIDPDSRELRVAHYDRNNTLLWERRLNPVTSA